MGNDASMAQMPPTDPHAEYALLARLKGGDEAAFTALAERLRSAGEVQVNPYLLRFAAEGYEITVFADARGIVKGTEDPQVARSLYARYIGL